MKKLSFIIGLTLLFTSAFTQRLSQITLTSSANSDIISFLADETIIVNMSKDGKIIDWGIESNIVRTNNYPGKLDKYMGREEYYPSTENEAYRGKIKYLGRTIFTYYTSDESETLKGKVKTMGTNLFDYYTPYDDASFKGNLKSAGPVSFIYFSSFDNDAYKGRIKTAGSTTLAYYGSFDDKAFRGKIKSIGSASFTYYSSYDKIGYGGVMKTGSPIVFIDGVKYYIRN